MLYDCVQSFGLRAMLVRMFCNQLLQVQNFPFDRRQVSGLRQSDKGEIRLARLQRAQEIGGVSIESRLDVADHSFSHGEKSVDIDRVDRHAGELPGEVLSNVSFIRREQFLYICGIFVIAGCYAFWMWLRLEKSPHWIGPGVVSLILFALLLTRIDAGPAGRAYAAYGWVYVAASIAWIYFVEGARPDRWDFLDAAIMLVGASVVLFGPRGAP